MLAVVDLMSHVLILQLWFVVSVAVGEEVVEAEGSGSVQWKKNFLQAMQLRQLAIQDKEVCTSYTPTLP